MEPSTPALGWQQGETRRRTRGRRQSGAGTRDQSWIDGNNCGLKNPPANAGDVRDTGSIPGSGRSPGAAAFSSYDGHLSLPLGLALGSPIFPSGCEGKLGVALESLHPV